MEDETDTITIRLSSELKERIENAAKAEERSLSGFVRFHLSQVIGDTGEGEAQ